MSLGDFKRVPAHHPRIPLDSTLDAAHPVDYFSNAATVGSASAWTMKARRNAGPALTLRNIHALLML